MSNSLDLISALYASVPDAPIPVELNKEWFGVTDPAFFTQHEGNISVCPLTDEGVVFFFGVMNDVDENAYLECQLPPTAALYKDRTMIVCWALDRAAPAHEAQEIADALGMQGFDEPIPVPPTSGWTLLHADLDTFYTLADLRDAYCLPEADARAVTPAGPLPPYLDAAVLAPYDPAACGQEMVIMVGASKESRNWKQMAMPVAQFIDKVSAHRVGPKDGAAFVLADMVPGQRLKNSVKALYGIGLDIDTGTPSPVVDNALLKLGVLAVRYTTHSHGKIQTDFKKDRLVKFAPDAEIDDDLIRRFLREVEQWDETMIASATYDGTDHTERGIVCCVRHKPMPKHRVLVPMNTPFVIADEGPTQAEAMKKWAKVPTALAELLGVPLDKSCTDPSRLFYFPRHDKDRSFEISLFGGPLFDYHTLQLDNPFDALAAEVTKGTSKSVTPEGRGLGRWSMKAAHGFQIKDVIDDLCPDRQRGGSDIECPFDENHSNAGDTDDKACFVVNAGDGQSEWFTISCRHEGCRDKTNLDMLGKMVKDGWFGAEVLEDEQYNALAPEDAPNPQVAQQIAKQDTAQLEYEDAIDDLTEGTKDAILEQVIASVLDAGLSDVVLDLAQQRIAKKTGYKLTSIVKTFKRLSHKRNKNCADEIKTDDVGRLKFPYAGEFNFDDATTTCFKALHRANEKAQKPVICHFDGDPVRLVMETKGGQTKAKFNHIENRALWSELNKLVTFVRRTEQGEGMRGCVVREVADHVYEQCYENLRQAPEVLYTPLFLSDGSLMVTEKYHYDGRDRDGEGKPIEPLNILMIHNGLVVPPVSEEPTAEEVATSLEWIRAELLSDFPFLDYDSQGNERRESSEANALAMLLTPFMRRMITGRTPVFWVHKPTAGTGGTLLGQLPMWLFDGAAGVATRYSQNEEEMQKGLIAAVQERKSHLFFDDCKDFNNRELLRAITQDNIGGRLLGSSKNIEVPNRFNWVGSGNNTVIMDEMRRRVVFIRLNAKTPDIQKRTYRHPDISGFGYEEFVRANRGLAIHHILTLIQYWISTGMTPFKDRRRASFEEWSLKVGGVLQSIGIEGFLDNLSSNDQNIDEAANKEFVRAFLIKFLVDTLHTPGKIFNWANEAGSDIIEGSNDDQKKSKFMKRLPAMEGQTFPIDGVNYMMQRAWDREGNIAFRLSRIDHTTLEVPVEKVAT